MRTLYLHIGQFKTGSSYLQQCFAASADALRRGGIIYPFGNNGLLDGAVEGRATEGNAKEAFRSLGHLSTHLSGLADRGSSVLLSSESFHVELGRPESIPGLVEVARVNGFGRIRMLLFLREPLALLLSNRLQTLKDPCMPIHPMALSIFWANRSIQRWKAFLLALQGIPDVELEVHHFGRARARLVEVSESWLGIPTGSLRRSSVGVVNRSLDASEAFLLSALKDRMELPYPSVGWRLVDRCPDLPTGLPWPSEAVQQMVYEACRDELEALNECLPSPERLAFGFHEPSPPLTEVSFSGVQLEVVGQELALAWDREASGNAGVDVLRKAVAGGIGGASAAARAEVVFPPARLADTMTASIDFSGGRPVGGRVLPGPLQGVVQGWAALDAALGLGGDSVFLLIEGAGGHWRLAACRPVHRPDVVAAFGRKGLAWCGFETCEPLDGPSAGRLHLVLCRAGRTYRNGLLAWDIAPAAEPQTKA